MGDVLLGPGRLYRAPLGTVNPDETTVASGAVWTAPWVDMGDFPEGSPISLSLAEEVYKVYSEQITVALGLARTRREALITGSLLEHTIANLAVLLQGAAVTTPPGPAQKPYGEIKFGGPPDVSLYKWAIEALRKDAADISQPVRWFFHKGFMRMTGEIPYAKTKETAIGFEISVLGDITQPDAENLGVLQIVTGAA